MATIIRPSDAQGEIVLSRSGFQDYTGKLYKVISVPGPNKDWESIRPLYHVNARLVRTGLNEDGSSFAGVMSFDEYIDSAETILADVEFSEIEIKHEARIFGNVAQVASVYESTFKTETEGIHGRGVNFFNLIYDGPTWLIMSIVWDNEREGLSLTGIGFEF